jgi:LDH2 family malate/lactate/ureidoglycolate dehydrogenase
MEISTDKRAELFGAISKMQGELTGAFKAKSGHGYNYADLSQCIKTAQEPLKNNGLAVIQLLNENEHGTCIETVLTHESGGYMSSSFLMAKAVLMGGGGKNPAQAMGATITYMRRYAYTAIIGMAQTDDDACDVVAPPKPTKEDLVWIDSIKSGANKLEEITDTNYRNHIQSFL